MKRFMNTMTWLCMYAMFAMTAVFESASIFVMRSPEAQKFILEYGTPMIMCLMLLCLAADTIAKRIPEVLTHHFDRTNAKLIVTGWVGLAGSALASLIVSVHSAWSEVSGLLVSVVALASIILILTALSVLPKPARAPQS